MLAHLPPGNIYRDAALEALDRTARPWRIACISESISGLQAAVFSGFAICVVANSALVPGMRVIGRPECFPELPEIDLVLHQSPGRSGAAANCLADFIVANLIRTVSEHAETGSTGRLIPMRP
jgi:DNA-binding transcriptional LysR family regulator